MAAVTLANGDTIPQNSFHAHNGIANGDAITHNGVSPMYTNVTNGVHNGVANGTVYTNGDAVTANGVESSSSEEEEEVVHVCPLTRKMLKQISQKTFQLDELDGVSLPPDNKLRELQSEFTPCAGDVFVVTYPKCGTIWTQHIVKLIRNNGVDNGIDNDTAFPWVELTAPETVSEMPSPRGFKSHLKYNLMPGTEPAKSPAKYIYVYRNPKDTAVSGFFQAKSLVLPDITWEKYFDRFMSGQVGYGEMLDHVLGWWQHKDADNILLVCFEDMRRDLEGSIAMMAEFLGYNLTPHTIMRIAEQTTFSNMKKNSSANMSWMDKYRQDGRNTSFMRKGSVGDWRNHFTDEQSARMDTEITRKLSGSGLQFDFGEE